MGCGSFIGLENYINQVLLMLFYFLFRLNQIKILTTWYKWDQKLSTLHYDQVCFIYLGKRGWLCGAKVEQANSETFRLNVFLILIFPLYTTEKQSSQIFAVSVFRDLQATASTEVYLQPCPASMIERFAKIINV